MIKIDGISPALTYALREALYALSMIEKELIPERDRADFIETVEYEKPVRTAGHAIGASSFAVVTLSRTASPPLRTGLRSQQ